MIEKMHKRLIYIFFLRMPAVNKRERERLSYHPDPHPEQTNQQQQQKPQSEMSANFHANDLQNKIRIMSVVDQAKATYCCSSKPVRQFSTILNDKVPPTVATANVTFQIQ